MSDFLSHLAARTIAPVPLGPRVRMRFEPSSEAGRPPDALGTEVQAEATTRPRAMSPSVFPPATPIEAPNTDAGPLPDAAVRASIESAASTVTRHDEHVWTPRLGDVHHHDTPHDESRAPLELNSVGRAVEDRAPAPVAAERSTRHEASGDPFERHDTREEPVRRNDAAPPEPGETATGATEADEPVHRPLPDRVTPEPRRRERPCGPQPVMPVATGRSRGASPADSRSATPPLEPTIHVSIGRVEIRATTPAAAPASPRRSSAMTIDGYLARRKERR